MSLLGKFICQITKTAYKFIGSLGLMQLNHKNSSAKCKTIQPVAISEPNQKAC